MLLTGEGESGACCCLSLEENFSSLMWKVENKIDDCALYLQGTVVFSPSPPCRYESVSVEGKSVLRAAGTFIYSTGDL